MTDLQELIRNYRRDDRDRLLEFLESNPKSVRHFPLLHAKVVLGLDRALVGSANLTRKAMLERQEIGVMLDSPAAVKELRRWFSYLWEQGDRVPLAQLPEWMQMLPARPVVEVIPPWEDQTRASRVPHFVMQAGHERLVERVQLARNRSWMDGFLELGRMLLEFTGLGEQDPRLVTSIPRQPLLALTVNQRYVLTAYLSDEEPRFGIILTPEGMEKQRGSDEGVWQRFRPGRARRAEHPPGFFWSDQAPAEIDPQLMEPWQEAVFAELARATRSSFRRFHEPALFAAIASRQYRAVVLDEAFGPPEVDQPNGSPYKRAESGVARGSEWGGQAVGRVPHRHCGAETVAWNSRPPPSSTSGSGPSAICG